MVGQIFLKKIVRKRSVEEDNSARGTFLFIYYAEYKKIEVKTKPFAELQRNGGRKAPYK